MADKSVDSMWEESRLSTSALKLWERWTRAASYADPFHIWRRREKATSINAIAGSGTGYQRVHTPYYYYEIYLL